MAQQREAQQPTRFDPFEFWRQFYEANEQAWTTAIKEMTTSQSFVEAQGRMLEIFLAYQKVMRDAMSTQLTILNMPTRDDVSRLGEVVVGVEEKVDQLHEAAGRLQEAMDQLNKQMARLERQLARQGEAGNHEAKASEGAEAVTRAERPSSGRASRRTSEGDTNP